MKTKEWINGPDYVSKPIKKALKEWGDLVTPMEKIGFITHAFDSGVSFRCPDTDHVFNLTISALKRLNKELNK